MRKSSKKGFTLIEIMIVVVIIGLLAALAIPAFNTVRNQSHQKAILANARIIGTGAATYMLETGATNVANVNALVTAGYLDTGFDTDIVTAKSAGGKMVIDETYSIDAANRTVTGTSATVGNVVYEF